MREKWTKLKEAAVNIDSEGINQWMKDFTVITDKLLPHILQEVSYKERREIMEQLKDIFEACQMKDSIMLKDAFMYGLANSIEKYFDQ